jgi:hypothetical protein
MSFKLYPCPGCKFPIALHAKVCPNCEQEIGFITSAMAWTKVISVNEEFGNPPASDYNAPEVKDVSAAHDHPVASDSEVSPHGGDKTGLDERETATIPLVFAVPILAIAALIVIGFLVALSG